MISYRFIKDGIVNRTFVLQDEGQNGLIKDLNRQSQNGLIKDLKRQIEVYKSNEKDLNQ